MLNSIRAGTPRQHHRHLTYNDTEEFCSPVSDSSYPAEGSCKPSRPRQRRKALWGILHGNGPQIARDMHPGEARLAPQIARVIATELLSIVRNSQLFSSFAQQVADGQIVDLRSEERAGRPSNLTPTKQNNIVECNNSAAQGRDRKF